ncbi:MAG: IucA/IucC family C-terminal-domain containing protein, partial [Pseudomonadota bacterium]|nr:IucA/IucC family C-terminal-domain containing protein [Pseudomonadota bacterium]
RIMVEPAYQSVDLGGKDEQQNRLVTEGFGLILRQGINHTLDEGVTPLLAGALFGNAGIGTEWVESLVLEHGNRLGLSRHDAAEAWFAAYVEQLMSPILYCFFKHGVIFEPHLQNVLIGLVGGCPQQLFLRDFEGVKLQGDRFEARLSAETEQVRSALCYSEEKGWKRIAYCLFVNNLCEAITQLAISDSNLEVRLWTVVREQLEVYQQQYGNEVSARYIGALLVGESFPAKANLINRFFKRADREVIYVPVHNPLKQSREAVV